MLYRQERDNRFIFFIYIADEGHIKGVILLYNNEIYKTLQGYGKISGYVPFFFQAEYQGKKYWHYDPNMEVL